MTKLSEVLERLEVLRSDENKISAIFYKTFIIFIIAVHPLPHRSLPKFGHVATS